MKILFLYEGPGWTIRDCADEPEHHIRYWLGKSPGGHQMEHIFVIPDDTKDYSDIQVAMKLECLEHEEQLAAKQERALYERLKQKYELAP